MLCWRRFFVFDPSFLCTFQITITGTTNEVRKLYVQPILCLLQIKCRHLPPMFGKLFHLSRLEFRTFRKSIAGLIRRDSRKSDTSESNEV